MRERSDDLDRVRASAPHEDFVVPSICSPGQCCKSAVASWGRLLLRHLRVLGMTLSIWLRELMPGFANTLLRRAPIVHPCG